ncbi:hypothetical protein Clacol_005572 [Clathrus columnatus]|uniref:Mediator of RNA polymerase II transcription subunit 4 n=1 Tax=Clathrus columnatus TaxID=1419009 RepID=A0AAV5AAI8_9AGAM|nr:hypothetical protein Clacol_005572 [Clathrus columnatus]
MTENNEPSMTETLVRPLEKMVTLSEALFLSLSPPSTRPPPPPATSLFIECDAELAKSVQKLRIHQIKQDIIENLKTEILDLDTELYEIWSALEQGKQELESILDEGKERLEAIDQAKKAAVPYTDLLAYAQSLSAFTSAPPGLPDISNDATAEESQLAQFPLFFPPFPNEVRMRRGRLNAEAPLGQLGEIHSVARPPSKSPETLVNQPVPPAHAMRDSFRQPAFPPLPVIDFGLDLNDDDDLDL